MSNEMINNKDIIANELAEEIKILILDARKKISKDVNETLVDTYWNVGKTIVEKEQSGKIKAEYGKSILLNVSKKLTREIGKGFSKSNLFNMRKFYLTYSKIPDTSGIFVILSPNMKIALDLEISLRLIFMAYTTKYVSSSFILAHSNIVSWFIFSSISEHLFFTKKHLEKYLNNY